MIIDHHQKHPVPQTKRKNNFSTLSFADLVLNLAYALGVGEQFQIWLEDNRHRDSSVKVRPILDSFVDMTLTSTL